MDSNAWSFRADRCATPAVFARGGGLITHERSPVGQAGVGFAYPDGAPLTQETCMWSRSSSPSNDRVSISRAGSGL